jgi:hypothetical protein
LGIGVWGLGVGVLGLGLTVSIFFRFRFRGKISGYESRVATSGFRVSGFGDHAERE